MEKHEIEDFYHQKIELVNAVDAETAKKRRQDSNVYQNWIDPYSRRAMTWGEVGCFLSHKKIWYKIGMEDCSSALILEDDALLRRTKYEPSFFSILAELSWEMNRECKIDLCYLSHRNDDEGTTLLSRNICELNTHPIWTLAYMVTNGGAHKLLERAKPNGTTIPADEFIPACAGLNNLPHLNEKYEGSGFIEVGSSVQRYFDTRPSSESVVEKAPPITINMDVFKDRVHLVCVATDTEHVGFKRLEATALRYGIKPHVLGNKKKWNGGEMETGTGGGQKINLLRKFFRNKKDIYLTDIIIFVDGYDVIITTHIKDIVDTWREMNSPLLFAAEPYCYPDEGRDSVFPKTSTPYKYLNSGGFIGTVAQVKAMLSKLPKVIHDKEDDQRIYTEQFLFCGLINAIDWECRIFQCLNGSTSALTIDTGRGQVINEVTGTRPGIIHANGPTKEWFDDEGAAAGGRWRDYYGKIY